MLLVLCLGLRDIVRICDRLVWHSPFLAFYSYWGFSFIAEGLEVWLMVQIGLGLAGVSANTRRIIRQGVPAIALYIGVITTTFAFQEPMPAYARICYVVAHLDQGVAFAWLGVFLAVVIPVEVIGIQWSGGVRGIAVGFALEIVATNTATWLSFSTVDPFMLANIKSAVFLASLVIWGASLKPRQQPDYAHMLRQIRTYLESFLRIFERSGVPETR